MTKLTEKKHGRIKYIVKRRSGMNVRSVFYSFYTGFLLLIFHPVQRVGDEDRELSAGRFIPG